MKLATFSTGSATTWGIIEGDEAVDVGAALRDRYPDLKAVITAGALAQVPSAVAGARQARQQAAGNLDERVEIDVVEARCQRDHAAFPKCRSMRMLAGSTRTSTSDGIAAGKGSPA